MPVRKFIKVYYKNGLCKKFITSYCFKYLDTLFIKQFKRSLMIDLNSVDHCVLEIERETKS